MYVCTYDFAYSFINLLVSFFESNTVLQETEKFRTHLLTKLSKKDIYGDSIEEVIGICTEVNLLPILLFCAFRTFQARGNQPVKVSTPTCPVLCVVVPNLVP